MNHTKSEEAFNQISKHIPGGVNTTLRKLDPHLVFAKAQGAQIYDVDGNEYTDYHLAFGPLILGHKDPDVESAVDQIREQMDLVGVGATEIEGKLADKISQHVPSADKVLFTNSGSEATYSALRLARAITRRKRVIKFQGCYHGWHDYLAMNVTSPADRVGKYDPLSAGTLEESAHQTSVLTFNSTAEVQKCLSEYKNQIAAIILEPIAHNMGCVIGTEEFLHSLRELCDREGSVLIFDEVLTGFRHALGGYQSICKVTPDLTTFGKAVANGYPMAGICGKEDMMNRFQTAGGDVFFAGTYNAHPYSCAASLATIAKLEDGKIYERLYRFGETISKGIDALAVEEGVETYTAHFGSVFTTYFTHGPMMNYNDVLRNNGDFFVRYRKEMIERGIFMLPLNVKRNFISAAHTEKDISDAIQKSREVFSILKHSLKITAH